LICEILKREKILLVRRYVDVEDEEIASIIEKYIAINIWSRYRLNLNIIYVQNK